MFYDVICIEGCSSKQNILCLYNFVLKMLIMKDSSYNDKVICPRMNYNPQTGGVTVNIMWLVVWNILYVSIYWAFHHPN